MRLRTAAVLAALLALAPAAPAEEEPAKPPAPAAAAGGDDAKKRLEGKVRRLLELQRWKEMFVAGLDLAFEQQVAGGMIPEEFPVRFKEIADFAALETIAVDAWMEVLDEPTVDAAIAFLGTEGGRKFVDASLLVTRDIVKRVEPWAIENAMKTMAAISGEPMEEDGGDEGADDEAPEEESGGLLKDLVAGLRDSKVSSNETAAVATLRNIAVCQAQMQVSGKIDADDDGIGEYGTLLEMTASAAIRAGSVDGSGDFSKQGRKITPAVASPRLAAVDGDGILRKNGYCYRIYLPDSGSPSRFTHEIGPAERIGLAGGTSRIRVDLAEILWCAYAWPEKIGDSGKRAFFVNQAGDVMQSANGTAKWEGDRAPPGNAAFRGEGITAPVAVGTRGRDGEVWRVVN